MAEGNDLNSDPAIECILRKTRFLDHLREMLAADPSSYKLQFFKRGDVITRDTRDADWICIVVRGSPGSVSVLKELQQPQPNVYKSSRSPLCAKGKTSRKQNIVPSITVPSELTRQQTIYQSTYQMEKRLEQTLPGYLNHADRLGSLPYEAIITEHRQRVHRNSNTGALSLPRIIISDVTRDSPTHAQKLAPVRRNSKGPYFAVGPVNQKSSLPPMSLFEDASFVSVSSTSRRLSEPPTDVVTQWSARGQVGDSTHCPSTPVGSKTKKPVFILVEVLEKGQHIGLADIIFEEQPRCAVVSNDARCLLISKKFSLQHLDEESLGDLRMTENKRPPTSVLQGQFQRHQEWLKYREKIYGRLVEGKCAKRREKKEFHQQYIGEYCYRAGPR